MSRQQTLAKEMMSGFLILVLVITNENTTHDATMHIPRNHAKRFGLAGFHTGFWPRMWYEKIEQEYGTIRIEYEIEIISITTIEKGNKSKVKMLQQKEGKMKLAHARCAKSSFRKFLTKFFEKSAEF